MNPLIRRFFTEIPLLSGATIEWLLTARLDVQMAEHPAVSEFRKRVQPKTELRDGIAIIPIFGALARRPDPIEQAFFGVEDSAAIYDLVIQAIADPEVKGILLNIDSPGGFVTGGPEIADAVARSPKPVVAFTAGEMASLAYWIGSQADEIVATRSAICGSIGAYTTHLDISRALESDGVKVEVIRNKEGRFKTAGMLGTALSDEQRAYLQDFVQSSFDEFKRAVTSARPNVPAEAMQGQVFTGREAKRVGLVDRIGDFSFALSVIRSLIRHQSA